MPLSDQFKYNVGDRVKNSSTQEDGRIINVQSLAGGALLVTVAIFVAGIARNTKTFVTKIGQVSGLDWAVVGNTIKDLTASPQILTPLKGGIVSAAAVATASKDLPNDRTISKTISDRLKGWDPRHMGANDQESYARAITDRINYLNEVKQGVFQNKGKIDLLMDYMTSTGRKGAKGDFLGSYLTELVRNKDAAPARAIEYGDKIRSILQKTAIPTELSHAYKGMIPEGVNTAWDLLVFAKRRIQDLSYVEGNPLWNDYAQIIKRSVELSPRYKRMQIAVNAIEQELDFTHEYQGLVQSSSFTQGFGNRPGIRMKWDFHDALKSGQLPHGDPTRFATNPSRTEPESSFRSVHELEVRVFGKTRKSIRDVIKKVEQSPGNWLTFNQPVVNPMTGEKFPGVQVPRVNPREVRKQSFIPEGQKFDITGAAGAHDIGRGMDRFTPKRDERGPTLSEVLAIEPTPTRDLGARASAPTRVRVGRKTLNPHDLFFGDTSKFEGKVVQFKGLPHRIVAIDKVTRRATLQPISSQVDLLATDIMNRPGAALEAVKRTGTTANGLPLEADKVAQNAGAEALAMSKKITQRTTIGVKGGLLGTANDVVHVPMDLLRDYFAGSSKVGDIKAAQAAGFASPSDFAKKAGIFKGRFESELKRRLEAQLMEMKGAKSGTQFLAQEMEDLLAGARVAVFEHFGSIQGGRSIQQIEEELLRIGASRARQNAFGAMSSIAAETFTGLTAIENAGEDIANRISSAAAFRGNTSSVHQMLQENYITSSALQSNLGLFSTHLSEIREAGRFTGKAIRGAFRSAFGGRGLKPNELDEMSVVAEELSRMGSLTSPEAQAHKSRLLGRLGLTEIDDLSVRSTDPRGMLITPQNEKSIVELYRAALDLPQPEQAAALRELGISRTLAGHEAAAVLHDMGGGQFLVRHSNGGLAAVSRDNPHIARFFGGAADRFEMGFEDVQNAIAKGQFNLMEGEAVGTKAFAAKMALAEQRSTADTFIRGHVGGYPSSLPIFRTNAGAIGYLGNDLVNSKAVIENTKAMMEGKRALLFLDIETLREVNQITNFAARRYELVDGKWTQVGDRFTIATPELWTKADAGTAFSSAEGVAALHEMVARGGNLHEAARTITRNNVVSTVDSIVANERELAARAATFLQAHSDAIIVGHNIPFDITKLAGVQGIDQAATTTFEEAARSRVADTILAAQVTHPQQRSFGLQNLSENLLGITDKQAHIADPDILRTFQVFEELYKNRAQGIAALAGAQNVGITPQSVLWTERGGGQAFKVHGVLNAEQATEAFYKQTGKELGVGTGLALQPIDFMTGEATGPLQMQFAQTPAGFARSFSDNFEIIPSMAETKDRMLRKAEDLAGRRVRRIVDDPRGFTRLLEERERIRLAGTMAQGPEAFMAAQDDILERILKAESPAERQMLRNVHAYSESYMQSSRVRKQLDLERGIFEGEFAGEHAPVIDWLEGHLRSSSAADLRSTKATVNDIWRNYMAEVEATQGGAWAQRAVDPKATVSLDIGGARKTLSVVSEEALRSSMQRRILDVARKAGKVGELDELFAGANTEEANRVAALLKHGGSFADTDLGSAVENEIFQRHISPALKQGLIKVGEEESPISISASTVSDAITQIMSNAAEIIGKKNTMASDYLATRSLDRTALANIHNRMGVGGELVSAAEQLAGADNLRVAFHHNAPASWTGKTFKSLMEAAIGAGEEEQEDFLGRMSGIFKKMNRRDQESVAEAAANINPGWSSRISGEKQAKIVEELVASSQVTAGKFNPGAATKIGQEISEIASNNAGPIAVAGLAALGIIAAGMGMLARKPQASTNKTREQDDEEKFMQSTEKEVSKRKDRVANQVPLYNRVGVSIFAEDPQGLGHEELTQSVHSALGSFLGKELSRNANVSDGRTKVDKDYIDRLSAQLIKNPSVVR